MGMKIKKIPYDEIPKAFQEKMDSFVSMLKGIIAKEKDINLKKLIRILEKKENKYVIEKINQFIKGTAPTEQSEKF